ncbi:hypothetical protein ACHWQZ_G011103 [Mnemiopsis leidyi]
MYFLRSTVNYLLGLKDEDDTSAPIQSSSTPVQTGQSVLNDVTIVEKTTEDGVLVTALTLKRKRNNSNSQSGKHKVQKVTKTSPIAGKTTKSNEKLLSSITELQRIAKLKKTRERSRRSLQRQNKLYKIQQEKSVLRNFKTPQ